jgi:uncharacterized protein (TIGR02147 family)
MDIYEYDDFRIFLKDRYDEKCGNDLSYSFRKFASEAGFSNPGFLNDVIKGRRKLSRDATEKMITVFTLSDIEAEFFRLLVAYRQTKNEEERQNLYKKIVFRRSRSSFARLNPSKNKYYQDFRYPLVRAAIMTLDFTGNYEELGRFTVPPIPAAQVKKYVRDLCNWGMVKQGTDGRYTVTDLKVEPPEKLKDLVKQINREWIIQSIDPLLKLPADKRHVSSILLSVSKTTRKKILEKIESFRKEIWEMVDRDEEKTENIMLLNIQYTPKSRNAEQI